jgi:hypothetical protein
MSIILLFSKAAFPLLRSIISMVLSSCVLLNLAADILHGNFLFFYTARLAGVFFCYLKDLIYLLKS